MLYTGPVVLKDVLLPDYKEYFDNFMVMHVAMRILLSPKTCHIHLESAKELIIFFLKSCKILYGQQYMAQNFHGLLHICDDIVTFGPLDRCSAFKFENFLYPLKKLVRKPEKPLQQIYKRLIESTDANMCFRNYNVKFPQFLTPHFSGPLLETVAVSEQFHEIKFPSFKLQTTPPNSCCILEDGSIVRIFNIVRCTQDNLMYIICMKFLMNNDIFGPPLCPSSATGILEVGHMSPEFGLRGINDVSEKMVLFVFEGENIVFS